jgi:hypothetical protein
LLVCASPLISIATSEANPRHQRPNRVFGLDAGITPTLPLVAGTTQYNIDQIGPYGQPLGNNLRIRLGDKVIVRGWAVDTSAATLAGGVEVVIDGTAYKLPYFLTRTDVAAALRSPAFTDSGYLGIIAAYLLPEGKHTMSLRVVTSDRKKYYETQHIRLIVAPD